LLTRGKAAKNRCYIRKRGQATSEGAKSQGRDRVTHVAGGARKTSGVVGSKKEYKVKGGEVKALSQKMENVGKKSPLRGNRKSASKRGRAFCGNRGGEG